MAREADERREQLRQVADELRSTVEDTRRAVARLDRLLTAAEEHDTDG